MNLFRPLFLFSFLIFVGNLRAANSVDEFFERLQEPFDGVSVRVVQDEGVVAKMRRQQEAIVVSGDNGTTNGNVSRATRTVPGYRVNVFSSNEQKTAKNAAFSIESEFKNNLAGASVYVSFSAPSWKVRVGDCRNYQEAVDLMNKLKSEFPKYKNSMFIVRDSVKIPL